jgi:hypothetical protein
VDEIATVDKLLYSVAFDSSPTGAEQLHVVLDASQMPGTCVRQREPFVVPDRIAVDSDTRIEPGRAAPVTLLA